MLTLTPSTAACSSSSQRRGLLSAAGESRQPATSGGQNGSRYLAVTGWFSARRASVEEVSRRSSERLSRSRLTDTAENRSLSAWRYFWCQHRATFPDVPREIPIVAVHHARHLFSL